jgi:biotin synthase
MKPTQPITGVSGLCNEDLARLLDLEGEDQKKLLSSAFSLKNMLLGDKVYFRGLIEFSNLCSKNCFYCGIRKNNTSVLRYSLSDEEIIQAAEFACVQDYGSIVLQSGELTSKKFARRTGLLLTKIHKKTAGKLRITLSLGEQTTEVYSYWHNCGAHRYLLRIETSNPGLYAKIHPDDGRHTFVSRLKALESLRKSGYQTGTGVMIGLPGQTMTDLANDLCFMRDFGIDMVGMGPYIGHSETPLFTSSEALWPAQKRFQTTLNMIALLRIIMPEINIAAATALQAIDKMGREKALRAGANVIMPNITPGSYRDRYKLYDNKPCTDENADDCTNCLGARIGMTGNRVGLGEWGDSVHFHRRRDLSEIPRSS